MTTRSQILNKLSIPLNPDLIEENYTGDPYVPHDEIIRLANDIFGHLNWDRRIISLDTDIVNINTMYQGKMVAKQFAIVKAIVEIVVHAEGVITTSSQTGTVTVPIDRFLKTDNAVTSLAVARATKKALSKFGDALGLSVDTEYLEEEGENILGEEKRQPFVNNIIVDKLKGGIEVSEIIKTISEVKSKAVWDEYRSSIIELKEWFDNKKDDIYNGVYTPKITKKQLDEIRSAFNKMQVQLFTKE